MDAQLDPYYYNKVQDQDKCEIKYVELDAEWEQRFREYVLRFDKDGDGLLKEGEFGEFIKALEISDIEKAIKFFCQIKQSRIAFSSNSLNY